jgi:biofilm protein TabA
VEAAVRRQAAVFPAGEAVFPAVVHQEDGDMIVDRIEHGALYNSLHPLFVAAFAELSGAPLRALAPGRHPIQGDRLYVSVQRDDARPREQVVLESHRKYIDIQLLLDGEESIGWRSLDQCKVIRSPYDDAKDFMTYSDAPSLWIPMTAGTFAIFFPTDAHAPLAGSGRLHKAVMKVAL